MSERLCREGMEDRPSRRMIPLGMLEDAFAWVTVRQEYSRVLGDGLGKKHTMLASECFGQTNQNGCVSRDNGLIQWLERVVSKQVDDLGSSLTS